MCIHTIQSPQNARIKRLRAIARSNTDLFLLEGKKHIFDALRLQIAGRSIVSVRELYIAESVFEQLMADDLGHFAQKAKDSKAAIAMCKVSDRAFESISRVPSHQGVLAVCQIYAGEMEDILTPLAQVGNSTARGSGGEKEAGFCLLLDRVQDPLNVGAVIRNCASFDGAGVIISTESANPYAPKAVRASAGGVLSTKIYQGECALQCVKYANALGITTIAADRRGEDFVRILKSRQRKSDQAIFERGVMFIFGSEGAGISSEVIREAQLCASIRMGDSMDSLNLAVASGIFIFTLKNFLL